MQTYSFYKWRTWSILASCFVMALFHRSALGVISQNVSADLALSASTLANLASITFYTYALMQIPAGILLDLFGYKRISCFGIFATGIGSILFGFATHLSIAYIGRFLIGVGTSVIFISILKAQHIWFSKRDFTKASGLLSFIGNLGGVIATFPLALLAGFLGWRGSMFLMGGLCLVAGMLILLFVKNTPTAYGFTPEGVTTDPQKGNLFVGIKQVVCNRATWRNFFVLFTLVGGTTTLTGLWGISYLTNVYNLSNGMASFYIAFIIYGLVIGSLFVDKATVLLKGNLMLYPRIACLVISLCWGYILFVAKGTPPLPILVVMFFIIGFFAMSHIVSFTDVTAYCNKENSGLASSIVNSGEFLGSSLISLCIGFFLDFGWNGTILDGVRIYEPSQYIYAFSIFFALSILGIFTSFIGIRQTNPDPALHEINSY